MLFWFRNKMYSLMLPVYLSKEQNFQTMCRKGQLFPDKKTQFSIEN